MLIEVKVPALSESVAEATLISWHKKAGEYVNRSENLIDIETDKVVLELPAPNAGVLTKVLKGDGATVVSGEVIAMIETEAVAPTAKPQAQAPVPAVNQQTQAPAAASTEKSDAGTVDTAIPMLMPAARKLVEENNLKTTETSAIKGTGLGGRITKEDVQAYMDGRTAAVAKAGTGGSTGGGATGGRGERRVAMSRLRQRIAERLVQSQS
ncbi:MAG: E3 binding domain-containing protein, partial [Betaproteobacteria bacterium]|nr:E3 binding domain-containing protein [Betaproteobacteria bacterium]